MTGEQLLAEICQHIVDTHPGMLYFHSTDTQRDRMHGFPDLVIVGTRGQLFAECKGRYEDLSRNQVTWKWGLKASGATWYLWRPADWNNGTIERQIAAIA